MERSQRKVVFFFFFLFFDFGQLLGFPVLWAPYLFFTGRSKRRASVYLGMFKAKILFIGPCESGKTVLANFLSDATDTSGGEYHPTQGVRILEFESHSIEITPGRTANCEVELWDCSGDHRFSTCWPALQKDTNGVVIVYNPDEPNHDRELETWYTQFVQEQWLRDSQCLVFAHHKPMASDRVRAQVRVYSVARYSLPDKYPWERSLLELVPEVKITLVSGSTQTLSKVTCVHTNLDEDPDSVREEFKNFLAQVISNWTDKRDQEELSIMNH
ncbi:hypothetical protein QZH41_020790 [Actinostola sp. cb2023]|nr:hypothetical protein QZH41_020790 [Actinostola sp. cb2023]